MLLLRKTLKPPPISATIRRLLSTVNLPDPPTSAAYDDLITTAGRERDFAAVRHLLNQRYEHGCFATKNTFQFISSDLSDLDDLLKTLADLSAGHCRKTAYDSLVGRLCKMQLTDAALRVANQAVRRKHGADARTFHPILSLLTRKKNFDESWRVMEVMKENGIARDVTCYNFLLTSYSVVGDLKSCVSVLKEMAKEGLTTDARTYDALVLGACKAGKMDGAMAILKRMVEEGLEPMYSTYAQVIGSLVKLGYCAQALEFVIGYGGKDKKLDTENFGLLATRLIAAGKLEEAKFVLKEMVTRDLAMGEKLNEFYDIHVNRLEN